MTLDLAGFNAVFDRWADSETSTSVFRWEGLQHYHVDYDEPSWRAHQDGTPWPDRSVRTDPWLARMSRTTLAGKRWERIRYVREPWTPYTEWELRAFGESAPCGELIWITTDTDVIRPDFWLFDGARADRCAVVMHYGPGGELVDIDYWEQARALDQLAAVAAALREGPTVRLNAYLARQRVSGVA